MRGEVEDVGEHLVCSRIRAVNDRPYEMDGGAGEGDGEPVPYGFYR